MINMNTGAEYTFEYVNKNGDLETRTILFVGLQFSGKGDALIRGYDVVKKEYRTFSVDNVNTASLKYVRG
jgi:predicted DNA-binding transcriptional regulator YafY